MALTEIEKEIIGIMHDRGISRDDMLGFTSIVDIKKAHKEMLKWLKDNPTAGYDEMLDKLTELYYRED